MDYVEIEDLQNMICKLGVMCLKVVVIGVTIAKVNVHLFDGTSVDYVGSGGKEVIFINDFIINKPVISKPSIENEGRVWLVHDAIILGSLIEGR